ncbi:hypothetical protein LCGC14_0853160 [marine sediment metagenome]|uniref:DUF1064 domain-containing protein n=1 Tax=marine sediment metagenome TaxID=412755 RepID=A0A0F9PEH4_9ZZZZ
MNKYGAVRTFSALCGRQFDSKAEMRRAEELALMEKGDLIMDLEYQVKFVLCAKPRITITVDFKYYDCEKRLKVHEDVKGILTRDFRTKMAWLEQLHGIQVILSGNQDKLWKGY